jgi:DNA polymerase I-like protein with 3'-5' exonuclease and polymerase domains
MKIKEIRNEDDILEFAEQFLQRWCFFDTETTGLYPYHGDRPFMMQFLFGNSETCFVLQTLDTIDSKAPPKNIIHSALTLFSSAYIADKDRTIVAHNAKFDMHQTHNLLLDYDINVEQWHCTIWDTMAIAKVLASNSYTVGLAACAERANLNTQKSEIVEEYLKANKKQCFAPDVFGDNSPRYDRVPKEIMFQYAIQDVFTTRDLFVHQQQSIGNAIESYLNKSFLNVVRTEVECTKSLFYVERRGVQVDLNHLQGMDTRGRNEEEALLFQFFAQTGREFVDSAQEIATLFQQRGITLPMGSLTKTGKQNYLTGEATLSGMRDPLADLILEIRGVKKSNSTFVNPLFRFKDKNNRIHSSYWQCGADTLRMSNSQPNLQNQPRESTAERDPRGAFIPSAGKRLISVDFDAMEAKIAVALANEKRLVNLINSGQDIHADTAQKARTTRSNAKGLFFGILYGSGAKVVARQLNISEMEANDLRRRVRETIPAVIKYSYQLQKYVEDDGFVLTQFGNPLYLESAFAYKALNYVVQGLCAQIFKRTLNSWVNLSFKVNDGFPLICVHDEIIGEFSTIDTDVERAFTQCFRDAYPETNGITMSASFSAPMERWKK